MLTAGVYVPSKQKPRTPEENARIYLLSLELGDLSDEDIARGVEALSWMMPADDLRHQLHIRRNRGGMSIDEAIQRINAFAEQPTESKGA
jgi:hypothetical protein